MIPVYLITGFLGSGKTTLLKEIYSKNKDQHLVYLVNEFSSGDVDGAILNKTIPEKIVAVPGGSIFCTCLISKFISHLNQLLEAQKNTDRNFDSLIIEASGMADPSVITNLFQDTGLDKFFYVKLIMCIVDPVTLPKLLVTFPNLKKQIGCAQVIILNKTDLVDDQEVDHIQRLITEINPEAQLHRTRFCRLSQNPLSLVNVVHTKKSIAKAHPPDKDTKKFSIKTTRSMDPSTLNHLIQSHSDTIYRIKGFIRDGGGIRYHVDYSISSGLRIERDIQSENINLEFIYKEDLSTKTAILKCLERNNAKIPK